MKKSLIYGLATLAVGVLVASIGTKKDKPSNVRPASKSYWK